MALAKVQQAASYNSGAGHSVTATLGATATINNLLVAYGSCAVTSLANITDPSGWTPAVSDLDGGGSFGAKMWWKKSDGTETGVNVTTTGTNVGISVVIIEFSGFTQWAQDKSAVNDPITAGTTCQTGNTTALSSAVQVAVGGVSKFTQDSSAVTWDSGFTTVQPAGFWTGLTGYKLTAANTTLNPTASSWASDSITGMIATFMDGTVTVAQTFTGVLNVNGIVAPTFTGKLNVGGPVAKTFTGKLNVGGPLPAGWTVRTEVAWTTNPLTRPAGGAWSTLVNKIRDLSWRRGAKVRGFDIEVGSASCIADNKDRSLDPTNTESIHYPNVKPRKRIRFILVRPDGTETVLFTGFTKTWPFSWKLATGESKLSATDLFGILATSKLPPSVLDVVTRGLSPTSYWPMSETVFTDTADDVVGTHDGAYIGAVQTGTQIVPFDARPCPKFPAPMVANQTTPAMVVNPIACPSSFSLSFWFQWDVAGPVSINPTLVMFQESTPPSIPSGGFTSPQSIGLFLSTDSTFTDRKNFRVFVTDGTHQARVTAPVAFNLLDGNPHHIVWTVDTAAKTFKVVVDNGSQITLSADTGDPGTTPLASVNVAAVAAAQTTLSCGWGIYFAVPVATQSAADLGQLALWNRLLNTTEIGTIYSAGASAWNGDTTAVRAGRILDLVGVDAGDRGTFGGTQICGPTLLGSAPALDYWRKLVATEANVSWINGDGKIQFPIRTPDSPTVVQVFSDAPATDGGVPYGDVEPDIPSDRIINTVIVSRENGADQKVTNPASVAAYGELSGATGGKIETLHQSAADARATGQRLVDRYGDPMVYIPAATIDSFGSNVDADSLIARDIGDATHLFARPAGIADPLIGGDPIEQYAFIEHAEWKIPRNRELTTVYSLIEYVPAGIIDISDGGTTAASQPADISDGGVTAASQPADISDGTSTATTIP